MEQEERESSGIARNQNVIYTLPHDSASAAEVLAPAIERIDESVGETQLLIITADADSALAITGTVAGMLGTRPIRAIPVTSVRRAQRLTKERPAHIVAGSPAQLLALLQSAALKLASVKSLVIAWADDIVATDVSAELEAVLGEIPRDAARSLVTSHSTPAVEALVDRYLRRARRAGAPEQPDDLPGVAIQYVSVATGSRSGALSRLLDELDPAGAVIFARSPESAADAERAVAAMGYRGEEATVRVSSGPASADAPLVVLFDIPASRTELRDVVGAGDRQVVALARPRQMPLLRALAGGAAVSALVLPGSVTAARSREERTRAELRAALANGAPSREMLALEPLLEEFDGVEIAAAALRLLEQARSGVVSPVQDTSAGAAAATGQWRRLFMSVGARDNVRPGDLVGAIAGEGGITSDQIGKIDLRDNHALVEIASNVADAVAAKMTGTMVRGRRVIARLEEERPARPAGDRPRPPRDGGDRPRRDAGDRPRRDSGDRPPRRDFGDRPPPRRDAGDRPPRRDAGDRPPRRDAADRPPRRDAGDRPFRREGGDRPRSGPPRGGRPRDRE